MREGGGGGGKRDEGGGVSSSSNADGALALLFSSCLLLLKTSLTKSVRGWTAMTEEGEGRVRGGWGGESRGGSSSSNRTSFLPDG